MEFNKLVIDLIKERVSTRTYDGRSLEDGDMEKLSAYLDQVNKENNSKVRFKIVSNLGTDKKESKKLGTYGYIQGANTYEFGYVFEKIIFFATDQV